MVLKLPTNPLLSGDAFHPIRVPGSKSVCNRALILAAMGQGPSRLRDGLEADDTARMRDCLRALGFQVQETSHEWRVEGGAVPVPSSVLPVGASGTTLRFLIPWLAFTAQSPIRFEGDARLFERPLGGLLDALQTHGARWESLLAAGVLYPSPKPPRRLELEVDGSASSQFLTGLAQAAAALPEGGHLRWRKPPASTSYLELTVHWLSLFGCNSTLHADGWEIPGGTLGARDLVMPGDWSGAAAFLCAAAVTGCKARVSPLDPRDPQGDRAIAQILERAGCRVLWTADQELSVEGPLREGIHADLELCPDLGPVLAATAALAPKPSILTGLHTLPLKECDRLDASAELVRWLGGQAEVVGDHTLKIQPGPCLGAREPFNPRRDHRMAFAAALGGLRCGGEVEDPGCVAKTLPRFWDDWIMMLGLSNTAQK